VRTLLRLAAAASLVLLVAAATVGAVALHARSASSRATTHRAELLQQGARLHDIRTIMDGSTLRPTLRGCAGISYRDMRLGHQYPPRSSPDWNFVMSVCAGRTS
jgi:hypothetical protein